jgi:hypothetical protein
MRIFAHNNDLNPSKTANLLLLTSRYTIFPWRGVGQDIIYSWGREDNKCRILRGGVPLLSLPAGG